MDDAWRPIAELPAGHYAVGRLDDGPEVDIYRAGGYLCNVATGDKLSNVASWRPLQIRDRRAYIL